MDNRGQAAVAAHRESGSSYFTTIINLGNYTMSVEGANNQFIEAILANKSEEEIDKIIQDPQFNPNDIVNKYSVSPMDVAFLTSILGLIKKLINKGGKRTQGEINAWFNTCLKNGDFDIIYWLVGQGFKPDSEKSEAFNKTSAQLIVNQYKETATVRSNISQVKIIRKFKKYIELKRSQNPALYPEPYYSYFKDNILNTKGFCNGYTLLWLYKKRFGMGEDYYKDLERISDWPEDLDTLNGNLDNLFRDMLDNILFAQDPKYFQAGLSQLDWDKVIKAGSKNEIERQFSIPLVLTKEEVETYLPECTVEGIVMMSNSVHATGYLNDNGKISYFDPSNKQLKPSFDKPEELTKLVQSALAKKTDADNSTMEIMLTQYEKPPTPDSDKEREARNQKNIKKKIELLDKIYESRKKAGIDPINQVSSRGQTLLSLACHMGDLDVVNWCLAKSADFQLTNNLMEFAANSGSFEIMKKLMEKGVSLYNSEKEQCIALNMAAINGNEDLIKILLDYIQQDSSLDSAQRREIISNALNRYVQNYHGEFSLINTFVKCGANLNSDPSLLTIAIEKNNVDMVRELLKFSEPNLEKDNPLNLNYSEAINVNRVTFFRDDSSKKLKSTNPLLAAVQIKSHAMCEALIEAGADVNFVDPSWNMTIIQQALANEDDKIVKLFIANGADDTSETPSEQWKQTWSSLNNIGKEIHNKYIKMKKQNPAEAILLKFFQIGGKLQKQIDEVDAIEKTTKVKEGCNEVAKYFETYRDTFKASDIDVESFINKVRAIERVEKFITIGEGIFSASDTTQQDPFLDELAKLCELGVNPNLNLFSPLFGPKVNLFQRAINRGDYSVAKKLLRFIDINHIPNSPTKNNVLMTVLEKGIDDKEFILDIISKNIDLHYRNAKGDTALMIALRKNPYEKTDKEIILSLIDKIDDINRANKKGETPLFTSLQRLNPDPDIVKALLEKNADVNHRDKSGQTILQFAKSIHARSRPEIMKLLDDYSTKKIKPSVVEKQPPADHRYQAEPWKLGQFAEHQQAQKKIDLSDDVKELASEWQALQEVVRSYELQKKLTPEAIIDLQKIKEFFQANPDHQADSFKELNNLVTPLQQSNKDPNMESLFKKILRVRKDPFSP